MQLTCGDGDLQLAQGGSGEQRLPHAEPSMTPLTPLPPVNASPQQKVTQSRVRAERSQRRAQTQLWHLCSAWATAQLCSRLPRARLGSSQALLRRQWAGAWQGTVGFAVPKAAVEQFALQRPGEGRHNS